MRTGSKQRNIVRDKLVLAVVILGTKIFMKRLFIVISLLLVSCSKEPSPYEKFEMETTKVQGQKLKSAADNRDDQLSSLRDNVLSSPQAERSVPNSVTESIGVELLWKIPAEPVIAYHFYYGVRPNEMQDHVRVPIEQLERLQHPVYGSVFRYRLRGTIPDAELFVSIRAENEHGLSPESKQIRVPVSHAVGVDSRGVDVRDQQRRY